MAIISTLVAGILLKKYMSNIRQHPVATLLSSPVSPASDLIVLRRGVDEVILLNGAKGSPVYLRRGAEYVQTLLVLCPGNTFT